MLTDVADGHQPWPSAMAISLFATETHGHMVMIEHIRPTRQRSLNTL
jgi:hypothetical protein